MLLLRLISLLILAPSALCSPSDVTYIADPDFYPKVIAQLQAGDHVRFPPGVYSHGLRVHGLEGTPDKPIVIEGPGQGQRAVFVGRPGRNTISIKDSRHVVLRNLELDGRGAYVDGVKAEGDSLYAHHITLENLFIHRFGRHQQIVGISTKCPAWGWVVRGNRLVGLGTGMYFGDSDGGDPFVGGLIEDNEIIDSIGYNLQIKHQKERPVGRGLPLEPQMTVIRRNLFVKDAKLPLNSSARPNVLVGHHPRSGAGNKDIYAIYGNFFFQNRNEALIQGEGNFALYSNLFFNSHRSGFPAIAIQPHNDLPRKVSVFHNTVVSPGAGIRVLAGSGQDPDQQRLVGNAVFAGAPIYGGRSSRNLERNHVDAREFLQNAVPDLGSISLRPVSDVMRTSPTPIEQFSVYPEFNRDYEGKTHDGSTLGAYSIQSGHLN